jgi:hypothetical protein
MTQHFPDTRKSHSLSRRPSNAIALGRWSSGGSITRPTSFTTPRIGLFLNRRDTFSNGDLLAAAEAAGFDFFVTADKNMQNLGCRE